jgi:hypothetical protein
MKQGSGYRLYTFFSSALHCAAGTHTCQNFSAGAHPPKHGRQVTAPGPHRCTLHRFTCTHVQQTLQPTLGDTVTPTHLWSDCLHMPARCAAYTGMLPGTSTHPAPPSCCHQGGPATHDTWCCTAAPAADMPPQGKCSPEYLLLRSTTHHSRSALTHTHTADSAKLCASAAAAALQLAGPSTGHHHPGHATSAGPPGPALT